MPSIDDEKIYFVGLSDRDSADHTHYICTWSENKVEILVWCRFVSKKFGSNTVMIKLNGKTLKHYLHVQR